MTEQAPIIYGLVDENNVLVNTIVAFKDDFETLERIKQETNTFGAYEIDTNIYIVNHYTLMWNGSHWVPNPNYT